MLHYRLYLEPGAIACVHAMRPGNVGTARETERERDKETCRPRKEAQIDRTRREVEGEGLLSLWRRRGCREALGVGLACVFGVVPIHGRLARTEVTKLVRTGL